MLIYMTCGSDNRLIGFSHQISHFDKFWSAAKMNGFEAFVVDLDKNVDECVENNIHGRTEEEILKVLL